MSDLAIGIMSGTSADGIDAALIEVDDAGRVTDAIAHRHTPYPRELRERVLAAAAGSPLRSTAQEIALLHAELGDRYAEAAEAIGVAALRRPSVIGLHGQTVAHLPGQRATLQIGDAARVAVRTGITTVNDFRSADVAAGGEGAPLTPFADHILFASGAPRVVINIGGIANVTLLPDEERDHVTGFDTGPGNMVIDLIARTSGREYDKDGEGARRGRAIESVLATALRHLFFSRRPPKSAGREEFGGPFAEDLIAGVRAVGGSVDDALATATELTARTLADAVREHASGATWREVLVAGGGARNPALMDALRRAVGPLPVRTTDEVGVPASAREAIAFAILAVYRLRGLPNTLPHVTGAQRAVSAGAVHRP
jgi:anhydro-N-acetylmuramic acid kinase